MKRLLGILLIAIMAIAFTGCDCACNDDITDVYPVERTVYRLHLDEKEYGQSRRVAVMKYNIDGKTLTAIYAYDHGIIQLSVDGEDKPYSAQSDDKGPSVLGQDSYFEY